MIVQGFFQDQQFEYIKIEMLGCDLKDQTECIDVYADDFQLNVNILETEFAVELENASEERDQMLFQFIN